MNNLDRLYLICNNLKSVKNKLPNYNPFDDQRFIKDIEALENMVERMREVLDDMRLETELKPCPHCGSVADWWDTEDEEYPYQISCRQCHCGTDETSDRQECLDDWNRRVDDKKVEEYALSW